MSIRGFYNNLPFNTGEDTNKNNIPWVSLQTNLENAKTVTELGCGTGWLCARIKNKYPHLKVIGIDISESAISQACNRTKHVDFFVDNLLEYNKKADVVISIGVLHHIETNDIKKLLRKTIALSKQYCFIGLYHTNSRKAMFDFFEQYPESKRKDIFKKMTPHMQNTKQRDSWFRDQFYNPYEESVSLKTLKEVAKETKTNLDYTNLDTDNTYNNVTNKLNTFEFTSGFIYGGYAK
tara:strand:+ start:840 stop:1547 length:708 start_codon:yes stop_codon:yes gene_type:complete